MSTVVTLRPPPPLLVDRYDDRRTDRGYLVEVLRLLEGLPRGRRTGVSLKCRTHVISLIKTGVSTCLTFTLPPTSNPSSTSNTSTLSIWLEILTRLKDFGLAKDIEDATTKEVKDRLMIRIEDLAREYEDEDDDEDDESDNEEDEDESEYSMDCKNQTVKDTGPLRLPTSISNYCTLVHSMIPPLLLPQSSTVDMLKRKSEVMVAEHLLGGEVLWGILRGSGNGREKVLGSVIVKQGR